MFRIADFRVLRPLETKEGVSVKVNWSIVATGNLRK